MSPTGGTATPIHPFARPGELSMLGPIPVQLAIAVALAAALTAPAALAQDYSEYRRTNVTAQLGSRPTFLVDQLIDGDLKDALRACRTRIFRKNDFSIGHRGACMQFPEHTLESYVAAARQGAGIIECDVTFTADGELVCRHSQCDLHTTTDIVAIPELNAKCTQPFVPAVYDANGNLVTPAAATCCTSDITLAEFRTLKGKMDASDPGATTPEEYLGGTADWRTNLYAGPSSGTLMTHAESLALFKTLRVGVTPELKAPSVDMPFELVDGTQYTYDMYRQQLIRELELGGIRPRDAWVQSFVRDDIDYWITEAPEFGAQAVYLDDANEVADLPDAVTLAGYKAAGINYWAPPMWALVAADGAEIVPSAAALDAKAAGLKLITWTLERSGILADGDGGWYYQSIQDVLADRENEGVILELLDVLANEVGVEGIFSDWPATVTFYANCLMDR
jgi:glycerophosphoryl diester phosphodiesterase